MHLKRLPTPPLRPFVALVWSSGNHTAGRYKAPAREHVLPAGMMHVVFRLTDGPLRIFGAGDREGQPAGDSMIGGVRSRFYVREMSGPSCSVGAVLRPGASELLFGTGADALAERHTPLDDVWGAPARLVHERMLETDDPENRLALLEATLLQRLPRVRVMHPGIASAIDQMHSLQSVEAAVKLSGVSHRQFISLFRRTVGLTPKTYLRVLRFQSALRSFRHGKAQTLASLAAETSYSDQAHFNREFRAFSGVTPAAYQRLASKEMNHLPVDAG